MSKDNVTRRISIFVNGKEVENSLRGVDGAMSEVRNRLRALNRDSADYDQRSQELTQTMQELRERQSAYREELGLTNKELKEAGELSGGLKGSLMGIWDSLVSGDMQGAKEGLTELKNGMGGLLKSTLAFIASPIGLAITALTGIVVGTKALIDYNLELNKLNSELKALGVNSNEISKVRDEISATAETFDKEFKEIAERANSLAKTYGISISEANREIAEGLASGGAQNEEFLDSLGEYDEFFAKAGFSVKEFTNIINQGYDLGIYSDKLPDALKEADLALKENTKSTRDALVNSFGASFSDEILNKVKTGELTTKQALEQIAIKAKESNLSQQQYAQLTADVFKGAGEDAGGAQKIFEALGASAKREINSTAKAQLELVDANERLNKAQSKLFEVENFGDAWIKIKASAIDSLSGIIEWLADLKKDIQPLIDLISIGLANSWHSIKAVVLTVFDIVGGVVKLFFDNIKFGIQIIKKLFSGDFKGAWQTVKEAFTNLGNTVSNVFGRIKNTILESLQSIVKNMAPILETLGFDVDNITKKLDSWKSKEIKVTTTTEEKNPDNKPYGNGGGGATADAEAAARKAREDAEKKRKAEAEKATKEELDRAKALLDAKINLAKAELAYYLASNQSRLKDGELLTKELLDQELKRLEDIHFRKDNELAEERLRSIQKAEQTAKSEEELSVLKQAIDFDYLTKKQELDLSFQQQTDALKKRYEEEQKALKLEQLALDNELALAEAATKEEADKIKQDQDYKAQLDRYKKLFQDKKITEEEYERFKKEAKEKQDEMDRVRDLNKLNGTLGAMNQIANGIGQLFGQSKELALVQAGINGAMAITSILAQYPKFDGGFMMWAAIAASTLTTAAQVKEITKAKPPKKPKFFYGGPTGSTAALGYDEFGPVTGYVHKNEYVIPEVLTQDPVMADTISWIENRRQRKLKGYVDGGETSPNTVNSSSPVLQDNSALMISALNMLISILQAGIKANVFFGYQDVEKLEQMKNEINQSSQNGTLS